MSPQTGAVYAMSSYPTYNPSVWVGGISTAEYAALSNPANNEPLLNRAIDGLYTPGSTFKLNTATAALDSGLSRRATTYDDTGTFNVPGCQYNSTESCTFHNSDGRRRLRRRSTSRPALTVSSDDFFYNLGAPLLRRPAQPTARPRSRTTPAQYGLGELTGIDLPGEAPAGRVDSQAERVKLHAENPIAFPNTTWYTGDNVEMAFGQGGTVHHAHRAGRGLLHLRQRRHPLRARRWPRPIVSPSGKVVKRFAPQVTGHVNLPPLDLPGPAHRVRRCGQHAERHRLRAFRGSASPAGWPARPGRPTPSRARSRPPGSWGSARSADPQYVVVCVIDQAGYGATAAAPVVRSDLQLPGRPPGRPRPGIPPLRAGRAVDRRPVPLPPTRPPRRRPPRPATRRLTPAGRLTGRGRGGGPGRPRPGGPRMTGEMESLWPQVEPLLAQVTKPARYIGGELGRPGSRARARRGVVAARLPRHLRDRPAQPGAPDPLRDPQRAGRRGGRAGLRPLGGHGGGHARGRGTAVLAREPPAGRGPSTSWPSTSRPSSSTPTCSTSSTWPGCRSRAADRTRGRPARGGRRPLRLQPRAAGRLRRLLRARRRRGGRGRDQRGPGGRQVAAGRPEGRRRRAALLRRWPGCPGVYVPSCYEARYEPDPGGGDGPTGWPPTAPRSAEHPRAGGEADHRRPGRLALSATAAGAAHRGGPRPPQRRALPGLHPGMPVLPGGHDHPSGARAAGRAGAHHGARTGLARTGYDEVALTSLSSADYSGIEDTVTVDHRRSGVLGPGVGQPAQPAGGRLHRRDRRPDPAGAAHRAHLRPRGRDVADAPGHQQAHPRGGPLRGGRRRLQPGLAAGSSSTSSSACPPRPTRTPSGIVDLAKQCVDIGRRYHKGVTVTASVGGFVPKAQTPFQWFGQNTIEELTRKVRLLRDAARPVRGLTIRWHDPKATAVEGVVSRGDRRMGAVIEQVWRQGGTFQEWSEHFDLGPVDRGPRRPRACPSRTPSTATGPRTRSLPWDHLSAGLHRDFLWQDWLDALAEHGLEDCRWTPCYDCGACTGLRGRARGGLGGPAGRREPGHRAGSLNRGPGAGTIPVHGAVRRRSGRRAGPRTRRRGSERGEAEVRIRFRFAKLGKIRFTSQRDVARMWERALRRAGLPLAYTEGFSPRPQLSFGLALPTGCESLAEYLDVALDEDRAGPGRRRRGHAARPAHRPAARRGSRSTRPPLVERGGGSLQQEVTSCSWDDALRRDVPSAELEDRWSRRSSPQPRSPSSASARAGQEPTTSVPRCWPWPWPTPRPVRGAAGRSSGWPSWPPSPGGSGRSSWCGD